MPNEICIEPVSESTFEELLSLIEEYQTFYRCTFDREKNRKFFSRLLDQSKSIGIQFIARRNDRIVGFATLYFVPSSLSAATQCVLNDLYTVPGERLHGVGRALIEYSARYAQGQGFNSLNWQTQKSNQVAQRLYASFDADKSEWFDFAMRIQPNLSAARHIK